MRRKKVVVFSILGLIDTILFLSNRVIKMSPPVFLVITSVLSIGVIILGIQLLLARRPGQ